MEVRKLDISLTTGQLRSLTCFSGVHSLLGKPAGLQALIRIHPKCGGCQPETHLWEVSALHSLKMNGLKWLKWLCGLSSLCYYGNYNSVSAFMWKTSQICGSLPNKDMKSWTRLIVGISLISLFAIHIIIFPSDGNAGHFFLKVIGTSATSILASEDHLWLKLTKVAKGFSILIVEDLA